jgi:phosphoesterase RecJ-like protein
MYKKIWNKIQESDNIVLISHVNPDGDALGSSLSMYNILKNEGKKVTICNVTDLASYLDFLPNFNKVKKELPKKIDLMISFDCGSFDRLGIERRDYFLINLDHHISNTNYGDLNLIEDAASTSQVVFNILEANNIKIDKDSATCIYTALVTDTGNFQYESVTAEVFRVASELVKCGASPEFVSKMLYERDRLSRLRFLSKALDTLELFAEGQVGIVEVTNELMQITGAIKDDTDGLVNMVRKLKTVEVAVMLREEENGSVKISLRSKNYVDVSKIAVKYGGGGHIRASGATIKDKTFKEIKDMIINDIKEQLK